MIIRQTREHFEIAELRLLLLILDIIIIILHNVPNCIGCFSKFWTAHFNICFIFIIIFAASLIILHLSLVVFKFFENAGEIGDSRLSEFWFCRENGARGLHVGGSTQFVHALQLLVPFKNFVAVAVFVCLFVWNMTQNGTLDRKSKILIFDFESTWCHFSFAEASFQSIKILKKIN